MQNAKFKDIIGPYGDVDSDSVKLRIFSREGVPGTVAWLSERLTKYAMNSNCLLYFPLSKLCAVGGIEVTEHFEVNAAPLTVQLTEEFVPLKFVLVDSLTYSIDPRIILIDL
jgi:hypothetical protein